MHKWHEFNRIVVIMFLLLIVVFLAAGTQACKMESDNVNISGNDSSVGSGTNDVLKIKLKDVIGTIDFSSSEWEWSILLRETGIIVKNISTQRRYFYPYYQMLYMEGF